MALSVPLSRFTPRVGGGSVFASLRRDESAFYASSHHYGKIITEVSLSELQRDKVSPLSVYGRQQARAKLDASKEQRVELGHDIFYLS